MTYGNKVIVVCHTLKVYADYLPKLKLQGLPVTYWKFKQINCKNWNHGLF